MARAVGGGSDTILIICGAVLITGTWVISSTCRDLFSQPTVWLGATLAAMGLSLLLAWLYVGGSELLHIPAWGLWRYTERLMNHMSLDAGISDPSVRTIVRRQDGLIAATISVTAVAWGLSAMAAVRALGRATDEAVALLARQWKRILMLFTLASLLLLAGLAHVSVLHTWPASLASGEDLQKAMLSAAHFYTAGAAASFTLQLALAYVPIVLTMHVSSRHLAKRELSAGAESTVDEWLSKHGLAVSIRSQLLQLLGVLSPIIGSTLVPDVAQAMQ